MIHTCTVDMLSSKQNHAHSLSEKRGNCSEPDCVPLIILTIQHNCIRWHTRGHCILPDLIAWMPGRVPLTVHVRAIPQCYDMFFVEVRPRVRAGRNVDVPVRSLRAHVCMHRWQLRVYVC